MQEILNRFFLGSNLKRRNSQEKETVSMKLKWRERISNLGTKKEVLQYSQFIFPAQNIDFLQIKKSQTEENKEKNNSPAL